MIDLKGTRSIRDGIGAIARVCACGEAQMHMQDAGVQNPGQNHARLHFGLAKNSKVDRVTVHWPSGVVQEVRGVQSRQVLRIREPEPLLSAEVHSR